MKTILQSHFSFVKLNSFCTSFLFLFFLFGYFYLLLINFHLLFENLLQECFQTFYSILKKERYNLRECFKDGFPRVVEALSYQTQMLSEKKPKLYNHFKKIGLNEFSLNYVIEWYLLYFHFFFFLSLLFF